MSRRPRSLLRILLSVALGVPVVALGVLGGPATPASALPAGFNEEIVFAGLTQPTKLVFSPDGRVFVGQKNGLIKVYDSVSDPTPDIFADLRTNVFDYDDSGLLGLAVPPDFPANPWVYVSYTYDGLIGGPAPLLNDDCNVITQCVLSGRLSRLQASGNQMVGPEQVLINDWCQHSISHSVGDLHFGPDGALYLTSGAGDTASFVDWGQTASTPLNPCGDPPGGVGGAMNPPDAEGGSLRAQDFRTTGDPEGLGGSLIRVNPTTGAAMPDNPNAASPDLNRRRQLAIGLRQPFRWTFRPGTNEVWFGDVGWHTWEEINRIQNPMGSTLANNFGWPCYEGAGRQRGWDDANLNLCESLYSSGQVMAPYYTYNHRNAVVSGDGCPTGDSSATGLAFYPATGGTYPTAYRNALFFADYARSCIWAIMAGTNGLPDPANIVAFAPTAANPVDLQVGPDGDVWYVDVSGTVRRFHYSAGNQPPTAVINATPTSGGSPLAVAFDGSGSSDPNPGDVLTYQWDFTNDGTFDASGPTANFTYTSNGVYTAALKVTDSGNLSNTKTIQILVGAGAPTAVIDTPAASLQWAVGDVVQFSGHATDPQQGTLPPSALHWQVLLHHCVTLNDCHIHFLQSFDGVASGQFTAPDHEYPSYLELVLTATDADGLTGNANRRIDPRTVILTFNSQPSGLQVTVGPDAETTPFTREVIVGSTNTMSAPTPQNQGGVNYSFVSWSDGGAQTHVITAPQTATTYTATYSGTAGCGDSYGYTCAAGAQAFVPADTTVLPLTGDEAITSVALPFAFPFYGQNYSTAYVQTNGVMSFVDPGGTAGTNGTIPSAATPNASLYPFWDDLVVKPGLSTVRTAVTGTAPNRKFIVEWRNVNIYGGSLYLTFEAVLSENGVVTFNYADIATTKTREQGDSATVGIENAPGTIATQYSANQAVLVNGTAIVFTPPGGGPPPPTTGTISGTVTNAAGGAPVANATVTRTPGGTTATTNASGAYSFTNVPPGSYTLAATAAGGLTGSTTANVTAGQTTAANISMTGGGGGGGAYTKTTATQAFVPADQDVLTLTGDDAVTQVTLPFAFTYYGTSYTSAWVDSNGLLSFVQPSQGYATNTAIPDAAPPNAAIYAFWDDLLVKDVSSVRTAVTGTAPNRQFIVEWRNVNFYGTGLYVKFEVILSENGTITLNYGDIATTKTREQGDSATIGIENASGTAAVQHSFNQAVLANGQAIIFTPNP